MRKEYSIGLDIGTNSVGYAVIYHDFTVPAKKMKVLGNTDKKHIKKNLIGSVTFDEGSTASDRRLSRGARRRYTRRAYRLNTLQRFFDEPLSAIDPYFLARLKESFLVENDKQYAKHPIFANEAQEKAYHEKFPTIYHLRKFLANTKEQADLRLVYLALAHIIKYRGHFLIDGQLNPDSTSVKTIFNQFAHAYNEAFALSQDFVAISEEQGIRVEEIITDVKLSKSRKVEKTLELFEGQARNGRLKQFLSLIVGNQGNFKGHLPIEEDAKLQFSSEKYDEDLETLLGTVGNDFSEIFALAHNVYDAMLLSGILAGVDSETKAKLSEFMVKRYETHKQDLDDFQAFMRLRCTDKEYKDMFKNREVTGYAQYIEGTLPSKSGYTKCASRADFYTYVKKVIEGKEGAEPFLEKISQDRFLLKQRTFENGAIPHQIQLKELEEIIDNQGQYYPFLLENKDKLKAILTFRIPYYVGPLAKHKKYSDFAWLERKSDQAITPWNMHEVIDVDRTAEKFIERMTNFDTYLPTESVLPKHSLIYEQYMIFNELTKVRYVSEQGRKLLLNTREKALIFDELFKKHRKVTRKRLETFFALEFNIEGVKVEGIEDSFNASYATYHDLKKVEGMAEIMDDESYFDHIEQIIKILTIFEDRSIIERQLSQFDFLPEKTRKKLSRKKYTGWGSLSKKLLVGIRDRVSHKTILDYLKDDEHEGRPLNRNLMQLINEEGLSFKEYIATHQPEIGEASLQDIVAEIPGSPAIKKGILNSLKIVDELVDVMGYQPSNIVVEMARENQTTKRGKTLPREKGLKEAIDKLGSAILKEFPTDNKSLQNDRLYLYYLQNGKDMYTGNPLDIHRLSDYDIDHIIPQSYLKDDSIDNKVLTSREENRGKLDDVPSREVAEARIGFWTSLLKSGLISQRKFDNLTRGLRGGLTEEAKQGFIHRQLVETRQITKHVARILHQRFNQENMPEVNIISLKSRMVSTFRKSFGLYKVRAINDYHHAHDAYLNAVVSLSVLKVYPQISRDLIYGQFGKHQRVKGTQATKEFYLYKNILKFFDKELKIHSGTGEVLWNQEKTLAQVRKVLECPQINLVKQVKEQKGTFSKEFSLVKGYSDKLVPCKTGLSTEKYGGKGSPNTAYTIAIQEPKKIGKKYLGDLHAVTIQNSLKYKDNLERLVTSLGLSEEVRVIKLPVYSLIQFDDGKRRLFISPNELQKANQLALSQKYYALLYHSARCGDLNSSESLDYVIQHRLDYDQLLEILLSFSIKWNGTISIAKKIKELYTENKNTDIMEIAASFVSLASLVSSGASSEFNFFGKKIDRVRYRGSDAKKCWRGTLIYQSITGLCETHVKLEDLSSWDGAQL